MTFGGIFNEPLHQMFSIGSSPDGYVKSIYIIILETFHSALQIVYLCDMKETDRYPRAETKLNLAGYKDWVSPLSHSEGFVWVLVAAAESNQLRQSHFKDGLFVSGSVSTSISGVSARAADARM